MWSELEVRIAALLAMSYRTTYYVSSSAKYLPHDGSKDIVSSSQKVHVVVERVIHVHDIAALNESDNRHENSAATEQANLW